MVEVRQSDIDLFISLWEPDEALVDDIQAGRAFTGEIKEIARHRIEAEQRGRLAGMEEAARIIETNVAVSSNVDGEPTYFSARKNGNRYGLEYADAIRANMQTKSENFDVRNDTMTTIRAHQLPDGTFVVADGHWLPGVYDSEATAIAFAALAETTILRVWARHRGPDGIINHVLTMADMP